MFHLIPDSHVILKKGGVFKPTNCYHHNGRVFAKHGGGYVRIMKSGTSIANLQWEELQVPFAHNWENLHGSLIYPQQESQQLKAVA